MKIYGTWQCLTCLALARKCALAVPSTRRNTLIWCTTTSAHRQTHRTGERTPPNIGEPLEYYHSASHLVFEFQVSVTRFSATFISAHCLPLYKRAGFHRTTWMLDGAQEIFSCKTVSVAVTAAADSFGKPTKALALQCEPSSERSASTNRSLAIF